MKDIGRKYIEIRGWLSLGGNLLLYGFQIFSFFANEHALIL